jgi:hypothetical protein
MEENNVEAPQAEAEVQEPQETQENVEPQVESQPETTQEAPQETVQEQKPETNVPSQDINYDLTQFMPQAQPQPQFTPDEDGFIDPNAFYNKVLADAEARIEQKMAFQESERRAWASIENKYPEIREDAELRDLVNSQRIADVARGGKGDLNQIAGKVLGKFQSYQAKGKAQAQVSEKVQKSAGLQQSTANKAETNASSDLIERMSRGDQSAKEQLIEEWLEQGKI